MITSGGIVWKGFINVLFIVNFNNCSLVIYSLYRPHCIELTGEAFRMDKLQDDFFWTISTNFPIYFVNGSVEFYRRQIPWDRMQDKGPVCSISAGLVPRSRVLNHLLTQSNDVKQWRLSMTSTRWVSAPLWSLKLHWVKVDPEFEIQPL